MDLLAKLPKTPGRITTLALGGAFSVSCVALLGDGLGHLAWFLPLAALNFAMGFVASERIVRFFLVCEALVIFGLLGYQVLHLHETAHT